ncbi:MAG TPA: hypothetical protein VHC49_22245 [Mycobacteriales bacterium]|nr:hypothetical protein [Mycobacteriales bacterium]
MNFCDPPDLFSPECMSEGILAALTSAGEFVGSVDPDAPLNPLTDEQMLRLRHYARGLADVE